MKKILLLAALTVATVLASYAGETGSAGRRYHRLSVSQEARLKVDQMRAELPLTEFQAKRLYAFFKADIRYRRQMFPETVGIYPGSDRGYPDPARANRRSRDRYDRYDRSYGDSYSDRDRRYDDRDRRYDYRDDDRYDDRYDRNYRYDDLPSRRYDRREQDYAYRERLEKYNMKQERRLRQIIGRTNYERWRARHDYF